MFPIVCGLDCVGGDGLEIKDMAEFISVPSLWVI